MSCILVLGPQSERERPQTSHPLKLASVGAGSHNMAAKAAKHKECGVVGHMWLFSTADALFLLQGQYELNPVCCGL